MHTKKRRPRGLYAVAIGIAAGFAFLVALFSTLDEGLARSEALTWVAIGTTAISIFVAAAEVKNPRRCQPSPPASST
ncbi:MAG: hypothetical protein MUC38_06330 [Cyclobacteriaceae bacterium]|nr:hypothetical protein [Cyclobacteriaceae bacterium]